VPVEIVSVPADRLPTAVETATYFLVAEALANAAKHADASHVQIAVGIQRHQAVICIDDDGRGGAAVIPGGGLAGLRDRIEAVDGRLTVTSRAGAGTHLEAEIPCG
jgi:signal transduction histidine kinase